MDGSVLVIRRIHAHYKLRAPESQREAVERVHRIRADRCPVARSIKGAIDVSTSFELVDWRLRGSVAVRCLPAASAASAINFTEAGGGLGIGALMLLVVTMTGRLSQTCNAR